MADIVVFNTLEKPGGGVPERASVAVELVSGNNAGGFLSAQEVLGAARPAINGNGAYSITLKPNVGAGAISPTKSPLNTIYKVTAVADGLPSQFYIQVDGSGSTPRSVHDILIPSTPGTDANFRLVDWAQQGKSRWPGDLMQLAGGTWVAVWERNQGAPGTTAGMKVFAAESLTSDPTGAWTEPWALSVEGQASIDPWLAQIGSEVFAGWQGGPTVGVPGFSYCKRTGLRNWTTPALLFDEVAGSNTILEGTVNTIRGTTWMVYNRKPSAQTEWLWTVTVRTITSNGAGVLSVSAATDLIAIPNGPGTGYDGNQTRGTIADTGTTNGLIITWSKDAGGGLTTSNPRDVWGIRSTNNGSSWGAAFLVADGGASDLVNPYNILRSDGKLRVYFTVSPATTALGYVQSADGGVTFGSIVQQQPPVSSFVQSVRIIIKEVGTTLYALSNAAAQTLIGVWRP